MAIALLCFGLIAPAQDDYGTRSQAAKNSSIAPSPEARTDINRATSEELMRVPGMTRSWADRIVRFRPYRSKRDLLSKGIVTGAVYDHIKDYVIAHQQKQ